MHTTHLPWMETEDTRASLSGCQDPTGRPYGERRVLRLSEFANDGGIPQLSLTEWQTVEATVV